MLEALFVKKNSDTWKALEAALQGDSMDFNGIDRLFSLYRAVTGHLNYARYHYQGSQLCAYLGDLTARAHAAIYANEQPKKPKHFFRRVLPVSLQSNRRAIWISTAVFLCAALLSFLVGTFKPQYLDAFLPDEYKGVTVEHLRTDESDLEGEQSSAALSNLLMVNNIRVAALAFALGITCGVGTLYVLMLNGFLIGALASLFTDLSSFLFFWSLILPHGIWELTAIFIAGGAGLRIGYSLIRPGPYRRRDALITAARDALSLMGLVVLLLIGAGLIEGLFTPLPVPIPLKFLVAFATAIPLVLYFTKTRTLTAAAP